MKTAAFALTGTSAAERAGRRALRGVVGAAVVAALTVGMAGAASADPMSFDPVRVPEVGNEARTPAETLAVLVAAFHARLASERATSAVATAMAQIGLPYVWGGNGPAAGDAGFDCSGLTTFSYAVARVWLPRTAHTQFYEGLHVPDGAPLQSGDLVFYGTRTNVHHVGMYLDLGRMVNAPTFGQPVQTAYYRWAGDDYLGATRPAATGLDTAGLLTFAPVPRSVPEASTPPPIFAAPAAPPLPSTPPLASPAVPPSDPAPEPTTPSQPAPSAPPSLLPISITTTPAAGRRRR